MFAPLPRERELWWRVRHCEAPLVVAVLVAAVGLLHLPISGRPTAAKLRLDHDNPGKLVEAEVAAALAECSVDPLADGGNQDPMGNVAEAVRLLQTAGVVLGDTVQEVARAGDHGACGGRGYPSARLEAGAHQQQVQRGALHLEVQQPLHGGHLLAPPFRPWVVEQCPEQVGGYASESTQGTGMNY
jgi:hypothetical protein